MRGDFEEPPLPLLNEELTPTALFFVRNHLPVPQVQPEDYRLIIEADVSLTLTLDDLKRLPKSKVKATLQCAGE